MIAKIEMVVIVIAGLLGAYLQFRYYWTTRQLNSWRWVKLLFSIVSLLWSVVFIGVLAGIRGINPPGWHQNLVLPLIVVTIVAIMASAIMRMRDRRED